jgi:hypothetical protein
MEKSAFGLSRYYDAKPPRRVEMIEERYTVDMSDQAPATRADLASAEAGLKKDLAATEERLETRIAGTEGRLRTEISDTEGRLRTEISDTEGRLRTEISATESRLSEQMRDMQTELLKAFLPWQEQIRIQFRELEANTGNSVTAIKQRMEVMERRLSEIEKKLLLEPPAA